MIILPPEAYSSKQWLESLMQGRERGFEEYHLLTPEQFEMCRSHYLWLTRLETGQSPPP
jgi:hypothetical protein